MSISTKQQRVNDQIRSPELRVIGADGKPVGVIPTEKALELARQDGLDLVEVSPGAKPPVAKILDYGAYRYRQQKQAQQQRKQLKKIDLKGVRIGMRISQHDFDHKVNQSKKFLEEGHKVKLELVMRGREQAYQLRDRAFAKVDEFLDALEMPIIREAKIAKQGNRLILVISADKKNAKNKDSQSDS